MQAECAAQWIIFYAAHIFCQSVPHARAQVGNFRWGYEMFIVVSAAWYDTCYIFSGDNVQQK